MLMRDFGEGVPPAPDLCKRNFDILPALFSGSLGDHGGKEELRLQFGKIPKGVPCFCLRIPNSSHDLFALYQDCPFTSGVL